MDVPILYIGTYYNINTYQYNIDLFTFQFKIFSININYLIFFLVEVDVINL